MTTQPEPNVDALAADVREVLDAFPDGFRKDSALAALDALARANTAQDVLLHDAMGALDEISRLTTANREDTKAQNIARALLVRFAALTGADT